MEELFLKQASLQTTFLLLHPEFHRIKWSNNDFCPSAKFRISAIAYSPLVIFQRPS